jgi:hypothetical protein
LLFLATRGEQGDRFPEIFWHHSVPLVACGESFHIFAKVGFFKDFEIHPTRVVSPEPDLGLGMFFLPFLFSVFLYYFLHCFFEI